MNYPAADAQKAFINTALAKVLAQGLLDEDPDAIEIMAMMQRPKTRENAAELAERIIAFMVGRADV